MGAIRYRLAPLDFEDHQASVSPLPSISLPSVRTCYSIRSQPDWAWTRASAWEAEDRGLRSLVHDYPAICPLAARTQGPPVRFRAERGQAMMRAIDPF